MLKKLLEKIRKARKGHQRKKKFKKLRKILRKFLNKETLTKAVVIASGLALIASFTLPYIL
ncbi:hypothetical protein HN803_00290 [candidate division WWE3 bacterium]|jgi:hypothetical protein|nr:hypothetical protein [candidate division WWE3 bacterium]MBT7349224.1 hypothetical protein [candidate division WWE3 bacterium]